MKKTLTVLGYVLLACVLGLLFFIGPYFIYMSYFGDIDKSEVESNSISGNYIDKSVHLSTYVDVRGATLSNDEVDLDIKVAEPFYNITDKTQQFYDNLVDADDLDFSQHIIVGTAPDVSTSSITVTLAPLSAVDKLAKQMFSADVSNSHLAYNHMVSGATFPNVEITELEKVYVNNIEFRMFEVHEILVTTDGKKVDYYYINGYSAHTDPYELNIAMVEYDRETAMRVAKSCFE